MADDQDVSSRMLFGIMCVVVPCLAVAWWVASVTAGSGAVAQFRDLTDAAFVEIRTLDGDVVMSGELRDRVDPSGGVEKDAALMGDEFDQVIGEIEIEIPRQGASDQRQELEVDVISLRPSTSYRIFVNDLQAATFTTDDRGSVDVEFLSPGRIRR
jgi:hypothetical protein